jgi:hypothetical protein
VTSHDTESGFGVKRLTRAGSALLVVSIAVLLCANVAAEQATAIPPDGEHQAALISTPCASQNLSLAPAQSHTSKAGTVITIAVSSDTACYLPSRFPLIQLHSSASGWNQVAKADPVAEASKNALLTDGVDQDVLADDPAATSLRPSQGLVTTLLLPASAGTCRDFDVAQFHPEATVESPGIAISSDPQQTCGMPVVLSYSQQADAAGAAKALLDLAADVSPFTTLTDGSDYGYGTDSNYPYACGSSTYYEPLGVCANGNADYYSGYFGGVAGWTNTQGCGTPFSQWISGNETAANHNHTSLGIGIGAAAFFMAGGAGRDPSYTGTGTEATAWGTLQAHTAATAAGTHSVSSSAIFMDIEATGTTDQNGWNTRWTNSSCSGSVAAASVSADLDYDTFKGFVDYIENSTIYYRGVYSAGGTAGGSWQGIMGTTHTISSTAEWTFVPETASVYPPASAFPTTFTDSYAGITASFFASAPVGCHLVWQWSGGNGVLNSYGGDYDQIKLTSSSISACDT